MPGREEGHREAGDDLVGAQGDREERVDQGQQHAGDHPDQQADDPRAGHLGAPQPPERAHQHHALEPDVDDAAALGEQAAERGEQQRRGVAQHRRQQRRPDEDALEVGLARLGGDDAERDAHDRGRHRAPSEPLLTVTRRPVAGGDAGQAQDHARDRRPDQDRRERDEEGEARQHDAGPADPARREPAAALLLLGGRGRPRLDQGHTGASAGGAPPRRSLPRSRHR